MTDPAPACTPAPPGGITVYGCGPGEAALFRELAPRFGVRPTITAAPLSGDNLELASRNRCVSVDHRTSVGASTIRALSRAGVRYISTRSVGYDHIDVGYAHRLGIAVEPVAYSPDSVADYTLMLMLMVARRARSTLGRVQAHDYRMQDVGGRELRDMTVGVVGTGRIGTSVLDRLHGFGGRVLAHDRRPGGSAEYLPLGELLAHSDLVTLHTPLTPDTHHLLNRQRIDQMKPGALVVNTARGALVDTEALVDALESGRLGGAALDVLEGEERVFYRDHRDHRQQPIESRQLLRLHALPNVVITPHTAYYTDHALRDIVEHTLVNCLRFGRAAACPA